MSSNSNPFISKESFLQANLLLSEVEVTAESKSIGKLNKIDLLQDEVWLFQCPKGMDVTEMQSQKLKIPGRSNINNRETVSMEFNEGGKQYAYAYCNTKKRCYDLRLLPVRGTIIVRDQLKAAESITEERAEECCPPTKKIQVPYIRERHPLLGVQYDDKLDKDVTERLQKADEITAKILKQTLSKKRAIELGTRFEKANNRVPSKISRIEINTSDDDSVEFVSEEKRKKKKKKKKHAHGEGNKDVEDISSHTKISNIDKEFVSKDLQWLQKI